MKRTVNLIGTLLLILLMSIACGKKTGDSTTSQVSVEFPKSETDMRIMSYNIRHCSGMDDSIDYKRISGIISTLNPDIVLLQELDNKTTRSEGVDQLAELSKAIGMHSCFGKGIDYQGGEYGVGILTKELPLKTSSYPLPGKEPRCALVAEYDDFVVICSHLDLTAESREASVKILTELAKGFNKTVYLGGDFNESNLDSSFFVELLKDWTIMSSGDKGTHPTGAPKRIIDYMVALKRDNTAPQVTNTSVIYDLKNYDVAIASDHYPLFCDLKK